MSEQRVGRAEEIPEGRVVIVEVDGVEVGVLKVLGQFRAYENRCPHQYGPVCMGEILGRQEVVLDDAKRVIGERFSDRSFNLVCPWHGWSYDVLTGEHIGDRRLRLKAWEVVQREGDLYVRRAS